MNSSGGVIQDTSHRTATILGTSIVGPGDTRNGAIFGAAQGWRTINVGGVPAGNTLWVEVVCVGALANPEDWNGGAQVLSTSQYRYRIDKCPSNVQSMITWGYR